MTTSETTKPGSSNSKNYKDQYANYSKSAYSRRNSTRTAQVEKTASIEFSLLAPYNAEAFLLGTFSDWEPITMEKDEYGYFRIDVDLADGRYEYKYRVTSNSSWHNGALVDITDPQATEVNKASGENSVIDIRDGKVIVDDYQWQNDAAFLPADQELIIYELHVTDFAGTFRGIIEKLDYLISLGVNAIELMPLASYPGEYSWGYNPKHFFAVESNYGSTSDFKALIDTCHARGIRVILDVVANHCQQDSSLAQIDHNYWFAEVNNDDAQFGPKFDYNHFDDNLDIYPARKFMNEVVFFWVKEYHLDGIRFDATALINNFDFMRWLGEHVKAEMGPKPFYLISEHIPLDPAVAGVDGPTDALWYDYFYFQIVANLRGEEFGGYQPYDWEKTKDALQPARTGFLGATDVVNYLTNHDHDRLMSDLAQVKFLDDPAFRRVKLGNALMMTAVGVPMIWMGEEFGEYYQKTMDPCPLRWELLGNEDNADLLHYISGLIYMRKNTKSLQTGNIDFIHLDEPNKVLAYKRWDENGSSEVVVLANFSDVELGDYHLTGMPADGIWHEYSFNYEREVKGGVLVDRLGRSECKIYIKRV